MTTNLTIKSVDFTGKKVKVDNRIADKAELEYIIRSLKRQAYRIFTESYKELTNELKDLFENNNVQGIEVIEKLANDKNDKAKKNYSSQIVSGITVYRVENDANGNPRYVVHYLDLLTDKERDGLTVEESWELALSKSRKKGGKVYRASWLGGGIVFQSYNIEEKINKLLQITK